MRSFTDLAEKTTFPCCSEPAIHSLPPDPLPVQSPHLLSPKYIYPGTRDAVAWGGDGACRAERTIIPIAACCFSVHKSNPQTRGKPTLCTTLNNHRAIGSSAPKRLPPNKIKQLRTERTTEGVKMACRGHTSGS